jgi:uncharacterized FlaG/YvyC family protein
MDITSVNMNGAMRDAPVMVKAPGKTTGPSLPAQTTGGNADPSPPQVKQMVAEMQSHLDSMNISLQYRLYGEHDEKISVKVVNRGTGEVIREIPPKEMQSLQAKMGELVGMIFNGKG